MYNDILNWKNKNNGKTALLIEGAFYWLLDACFVNIAYNTTEPNIGLGQRIDNNSLKCYMFDTGLLLSMTFNEKNIINEEIYI